MPNVILIERENLMRDGQNSTWLNDSYVEMLKGLSPQRKKDIIAKLLIESNSSDTPDKSLFWESYGGWVGEESAEDIINGIRSSRHFSRIIEEL